MANVIDTKMIIKGDMDFINKVKEIINIGQSILDTFIPKPKELNKIKADRFVSQLDEDVSPEALMEQIKALKEDQACIDNFLKAWDCKKKYGYASWRSWGYGNWGVQIQEICPAIDAETEDSITISFETDWDYPKEFLKALAKKYPKLVIEGIAYDCDYGNAYKFIVKNSRLIKLPYIELKYSDDGSIIEENSAAKPDIEDISYRLIF